MLQGSNKWPDRNKNEHFLEEHFSNPIPKISPA